jgi:hypothetical protein
MGVKQLSEKGSVLEGNGRTVTVTVSKKIMIAYARGKL